MKQYPSSRANFRSALWAVGDGPQVPVAQLAADVVSGLLGFGSETPDNLQAAERLDVSVEDTAAGRTVGLSLRGGPRLSRLLKSAEGCDIPPGVQEDLPELTRVGWNAVLRVSVLILAALESGVLEPSNAIPSEVAFRRCRSALWAVGDGPQVPVAQLAADVVSGLPDFGLETPDNLQAAGQLDASVEESAVGRNVGLSLKDYQVRLSEVLWLSSGCGIPEQVRSEFPGLAEVEWQVALRVTKLVLLALESEYVKA